MAKLSPKLLQHPTQLIEDFYEDCKIRGMTNETIRRYKSSLKIFTRFLRDRELDLSHVNKDMLWDFLHFIKYERKVKNKTVENYFSALSSFFNYLVYHEVTNTNHVLVFRKR